MKANKQLALFMGIQASGKSSFFYERFRASHVHLSLDVVKTRRRQMILFEACLKAEQPLVLDNTNHTRETRAHFIKMARQAGFAVVGYYFDTRLDDALRRNAGRGGKARVRPSIIRGTERKMELPIPEEGFERLVLVKLDEEVGGFTVQLWDGKTPVP